MPNFSLYEWNCHARILIRSLSEKSAGWPATCVSVHVHSQVCVCMHVYVHTHTHTHHMHYTHSYSGLYTRFLLVHNLRWTRPLGTRLLHKQQHVCMKTDGCVSVLMNIFDFYRQKALGGFSDILRTIAGLPKEWITTCRPCSPRVLFLFESCPSIYREHKTNVARAALGESN